MWWYRHEVVPLYALSCALLGLGLWLLWLNFGSRIHRAFSLFLVLFGLTILDITLSFVATDPARVLLFARLFPYLFLPFAVALAYFAAVYPRPRTWFGTSRLGPWVLFGSALLLEVVYFLDHSLYASYEFTPVRDERAYGNLVFVGMGPLYLLTACPFLLFSIMGLVFASDYFSAPKGARRESAFVVLSAFTLCSVVSLVSVIPAFAALFDAKPSLGLWEDVATWVNLSKILPSVGLGYFLVREFRLTKDAQIRHQLMRLFRALSLPAATGAVAVAASATGYPTIATWVIVFWFLLMPAMVCYAIVRYQLFGIDLKIHWTIKQSTVAGLFLAVFFLVEQAAQAVLQRGESVYLGAAAMVMLAFAVHPVQRLAERVANRVVPRPRGVNDLSPHEREAVYEEQARIAWEDGVLRAHERRMLRRLRQRLAVSAERAEEIESRLLGTFHARKAAASTRISSRVAGPSPRSP